MVLSDKLIQLALAEHCVCDVEPAVFPYDWLVGV